MRKFFSSFSRLLIALRDGTISDSDLATGLFCFGATRLYVFDPSILKGENDVGRIFMDQEARGCLVHGQIIDVIVKAEQQGRIAWRPVEGSHTIQSVGSMLGRNGFPDFCAHNNEVSSGEVVSWLWRFRDQLEII